MEKQWSHQDLGQTHAPGNTCWGDSILYLNQYPRVYGWLGVKSKYGDHNLQRRFLQKRLERLPWHSSGLDSTLQCVGFPGGSDGKESACSAGDLALIPGLGRYPGGGHGNPLQYSGPENPWSHKESDTTEQISLCIVEDTGPIPGRGAEIPHATEELSLHAATTETVCHN